MQLLDGERLLPEAGQWGCVRGRMVGPQTGVTTGTHRLRALFRNQPLTCSGSSGGMCELVLPFQSWFPLPTAAGCSLLSWHGTGWAMQLPWEVERGLLGRGLTQAGATEWTGYRIIVNTVTSPPHTHKPRGAGKIHFLYVPQSLQTSPSPHIWVGDLAVPKPGAAGSRGSRYTQDARCFRPSGLGAVLGDCNVTLTWETSVDLTTKCYKDATTLGSGVGLRSARNPSSWRPHHLNTRPWQLQRQTPVRPRVKASDTSAHIPLGLA